MYTTTTIILVHAITVVRVWLRNSLWYGLHLGKGYLKADDLCLLILYGCSIVWQVVSFFLPEGADAFEGRRSSFAQIYTMDQRSINTPNPKCRLYWCLIEFIDWRHRQSWWYFRTLLWTSAPRREGIGRLCGQHIQEFYTVYLIRVWTYKIALPPQTKTYEGRGLRQINTCRQVPLLVNF